MSQFARYNMSKICSRIHTCDIRLARAVRYITKSKITNYTIPGSVKAKLRTLSLSPGPQNNELGGYYTGRMPAFT